MHFKWWIYKNSSKSLYGAWKKLSITCLTSCAELGSLLNVYYLNMALSVCRISQWTFHACKHFNFAILSVQSDCLGEENEAPVMMWLIAKMGQMSQQTKCCVKSGAYIWYVSLGRGGGWRFQHLQLTRTGATFLVRVHLFQEPVSARLVPHK